MNIKKIVLDKAAELGEKAPEFFDYSAKTIESWKKKPNTIPIKAIEKVLSEQTAQPGASDPTPAQSQATPETPPTYTLANAQTDINSIVQHFNAKVSPAIQSIETATVANANLLTSLAATVRELTAWRTSVTSQQGQAPTVGQVMAAQTSDFELATPTDLPSRINPAQKATVLGEFTSGNGGHPLDTGIAPTAQQRASSLGSLADGVDPQNPRKPAGPAVPGPMNAPGMTGWAKPWPAKR